MIPAAVAGAQKTLTPVTTATVPAVTNRSVKFILLKKSATLEKKPPVSLDDLDAARLKNCSVCSCVSSILIRSSSILSTAKVFESATPVTVKSISRWNDITNRFVISLKILFLISRLASFIETPAPIPASKSIFFKSATCSLLSSFFNDCVGKVSYLGSTSTGYSLLSFCNQE